MKAARVVWLDAHGGAGEWHEMPTAYEPLEVTSIGFIQEYPQGVVVIPNHAPDPIAAQCFGEVHIPRGCIVSLTQIEV